MTYIKQFDESDCAAERIELVATYSVRHPSIKKILKCKN